MRTLRNSVQLIGNLGIDPEIRETQNGKKVVRLAIATNETYKDNNGKKVTDTQWHNVVVWGKTAEIAEKFLEKGREVAIEGKLRHRSWEDKEGEKHYTTEVVANELVLLNNSSKN